jgi:hypothetical protein
VRIICPATSFSIAIGTSTVSLTSPKVRRVGSAKTKVIRMIITSFKAKLILRHLDLRKPFFTTILLNL